MTTGGLPSGSQPTISRTRATMMCQVERCCSVDPRGRQAQGEHLACLIPRQTRQYDVRGVLDAELAQPPKAMQLGLQEAVCHVHLHAPRVGMVKAMRYP
jgi:hypothetical protein